MKIHKNSRSLTSNILKTKFLTPTSTLKLINIYFRNFKLYIDTQNQTNKKFQFTKQTFIKFNNFMQIGLYFF